MSGKCKTYTLGGFNFILFGDFNKNQKEIERYRQKMSFYILLHTFYQQSFTHLHLKIGEVIILPQKYFSINFRQTR